MKRILLLIEHRQNGRLLSDWLANRYTVIKPDWCEEDSSEADSSDHDISHLEFRSKFYPIFQQALLTTTFDLCILDARALDQLWQAVQDKRAVEQPLFLPFLLVTNRQDVKYNTRDLWQCIDDLTTQPIEKIELQARVEILLRSRQQSLQLQAVNQSLEQEIRSRQQAEAERDQLLQREQSARQQAEAANRVKDEFLAVLSHELRTPLNPILGWAKLLRQAFSKSDASSRSFDDATVCRALETIENNAKLQTQLIEDLLDISRILSGKLVLDRQPVNLTEPIQAALETVRLSAEAKAIRIQTQLEPVLVLGDANRLQQVFWNLLSNAIKFTPTGGRIEVCLQQAQNQQAQSQQSQSQQAQHQAEVIVRDTGRGITASFLPYIFESFQQADGSTTRHYGGLGLGLAIVRQIVELHGGTIQAESEGEQQGSTFTVRFPNYEVPKFNPLDPSSSHSDDPSDAVALSGVQILVVDDDADSRELVTFLLEQAGATVTAVCSAQAALTAINQNRPDLLISDIGMPTIDGYMLMQQIRTKPAFGDLPAIALTAYASRQDQRQALKAGFQRHIAKPAEATELIQTVSSLVRA